VQRYVSSNWKFLRLSYFEKIEGAGRTDGWTDRRTGATLNMWWWRGLVVARWSRST